MPADLQAEATEDVKAKSAQSAGVPGKDEVRLSDVPLSPVSPLHFA